jgi:hypothetical protein
VYPLWGADRILPDQFVVACAAQKFGALGSGMGVPGLGLGPGLPEVVGFGPPTRGWKVGFANGEVLGAAPFGCAPVGSVECDPAVDVWDPGDEGVSGSIVTGTGPLVVVGLALFAPALAGWMVGDVDVAPLAPVPVGGAAPSGVAPLFESACPIHVAAMPTRNANAAIHTSGPRKRLPACELGGVGIGGGAIRGMTGAPGSSGSVGSGM